MEIVYPDDNKTYGALVILLHNRRTVLNQREQEVWADPPAYLPLRALAPRGSKRPAAAAPAPPVPTKKLIVKKPAKFVARGEPGDDDIDLTSGPASPDTTLTAAIFGFDDTLSIVDVGTPVRSSTPMMTPRQLYPSPSPNSDR